MVIEPLEPRMLLTAASFAWSMAPQVGSSDGGIDLSNTVSNGFPVTLDGTLSAGTRLKYSWKVAVPGLRRPLTHSGATWTPQLQSGVTYTVTLKVTPKKGKAASTTQFVTPRDLLVVSMGDSIASGEGNPDVPADQSADGQPHWANSPYSNVRHFSSIAAPVQLAEAMQQAADPHTRVTFISVASSGASIENGLVGAQQGTGLPAQVDQVRNLVGSRSIDALLISIGGNDVGFADDVEQLLFGLTPDVQTPLNALQGEFNDLYADIHRQLNVSDGSVYCTEYGDPVSGTPHSILGDATNGFFTLNESDMEWARQNILYPLDTNIYGNAHRLGWHYVGGIVDAFQGHGYDTPDSWIVSYSESMSRENEKTGVLHPNAEGQTAIAEILEANIMPVFGLAA
jgi:hypothetical protein